MEKKQFQAESKRLLEMMIHSIYTHKEIFLRELISNASDAIDKLYFKSLTDDQVGLSKDDFCIRLTLDKEARTLTIQDNGIGMTREELENNLGVIAQSGSLAFKKENQLGDDVDIIGQFGVGFYSAFMVASEVTVTTKAYGSNQAYRWVSEGVEGYTIEECEKDSVGTCICLRMKENTEDENYDDFLEQYRISGLVKKYSNYIRFPIKMEMERERLKEKPEDAPEGAPDEYESYKEDVTMNSMVPIWRKNKNELTDEDYISFYQEKFYDYEKPLRHMHVKNEGAATYDALLYIPSRPPYDYYTKEFEKGLQLFSNGVLIMEKCGDLLPDYFSFVRGLVDSEDLSLNISREMLQHDRQLKLIAKSLEITIKNELDKMLKTDRETYEKFFEKFGLQLKFGVYDNYGAAKDTLKDLVLFHSSNGDSLTTLKEYVTRMKEDQKYIFYAAGDNLSMVEHLPQTELVKEKGYEILYFVDNVDEFAIHMLQKYEDKEFKSVSAGDLDLDSETEKEEMKKQAEENKDMLSFLKDSLDGKVAEVKLSSRLKSHPVCLSSGGPLSIEMEKVLNTMPNNEKVKADKVLEVNASHPIFQKLQGLYGENKEKLKAYCNLLYTQALLMEGLPVEDPVAFSNAICDLMVEK